MNKQFSIFNKIGFNKLNSSKKKEKTKLRLKNILDNYSLKYFLKQIV